MKRVALVISQSFGYGRGIIRGAMSFAKPHKDWRFTLIDAQASHVRDSLETFKPDGAIGHLFTYHSVVAAEKVNCPIVNTSNATPAEFPRIGVDDLQIGKLAAQHFLERGFRYFAFFGCAGAFVAARRQSFVTALTDAGIEADAIQHWSDTNTDLRDLLIKSPKPLAIFAASDPLCWQMAEFCRNSGVSIPDQAALLGVDNDEFLCGLASPQLSSIRLPLEKIGYAAAELLDKLLQGQPPPEGPVLLPPVEVVTRQSTDVYAVEDQDVADALRFIQHNVRQPLKVESILKHLNISRRTLENKFNKVLGCTPLQMIHRAQVERASRLLGTTDMPLRAIAQDCGFTSNVQFWSVFKQIKGVPPVEHRKSLTRRRI